MIKNKINNYIRKSKEYSKKVVIAIVGNAKEITKVDEDYTNGTSIVSEYYALQKFNQIVDTLKSEGFETISYYDKMDFIYDVLTHRIRNNYYKPIIVFNFAQKGIVHGRKSLIPLFCEMNSIIHTNSDPMVCSLTREKYFWYKLLNGICPVCPTWEYDAKLNWISGKPETGTKVIAKLENQCSSIGLTSENVFTFSDAKIDFLYNLSTKYSCRVILQKFIEGYEVEFPFCYDGNEAFCLKPQGIKIKGENYIGEKILDYDARRTHSYEFYNFDEFNPELSQDISSSIVRVAKIMNLQGMGRIDCRIDKADNFFITDINSNPHLIEIASPSESLKQLGFSEYSDLLNLIIGITITRHPNQIML